MTASSDLGSNNTSTFAPSWGFDKQKLDSKVLSRFSTEYLMVGPLGPSPSVRKPITRPTVRCHFLRRLNQTISRQTASPRNTAAKQMATSCPGLIGFLANSVIMPHAAFALLLRRAAYHLHMQPSGRWLGGFRSCRTFSAAGGSGKAEVRAGSRVTCGGGRFWISWD